MKVLQILLFGLVMGVGLSQNAFAADLKVSDIRYGRQADGLYRIVLDLSAGVAVERLSSAEGDLVVRLPDAELRPGVSTQGFDRRYVRSLRIKQDQQGGLELVVRPRSGFSTRVFQLKPYQQRGRRLVIDLVPAPQPVIAPSTGSAAVATPVTESLVPQQHPEKIRAGSDANKSARPSVLSSPVVSNEEGADVSLSGNVSMQGRGFAHSGAAQQHGAYLSIAIEPEWYWSKGDNSLTFTPFFRWDQYDDERTHFDVRELMFSHVGDGWEIQGGVGKVFWGVTEASHLVDIINQTDLVENLDGEQKLGQPMLRVSLEKNWGTIDLFAMSGFRERTYPGKEGRFLFTLPVATDLARYEDGRDQWSPDLAIRWSNYINDWDIGLSHFHGTGREPSLVPGLDGGGNPVLIPVYQLIDQTGLDLQATKGDWLWKLEVIRRSGQGDAFFAADGGFEYTFVGVADSASDVGILLEVMLDERGEEATTPFNHDLFAGVRWTANDAQSTELLAGVVYDWETDAQMFNLEANRRIGEAWKLSVQARTWLRTKNDPSFSAFGKEDYLEVQMARYF